MAISIGYRDISARLGPRAKPTVSTVGEQAKAQTAAQSLQIASTSLSFADKIYEEFSRASAVKAQNEMEVFQAQYNDKTDEFIANAKTDKERAGITSLRAARWEEQWDEKFKEVSDGSIAKGKLELWNQRERPLAQIHMRDATRKAYSKVTRQETIDQLLVKVKVDPQDAVKDAYKVKAIIGDAAYKSIVMESNKNIKINTKRAFSQKAEGIAKTEGMEASKQWVRENAPDSTYGNSVIRDMEFKFAAAKKANEQAQEFEVRKSEFEAMDLMDKNALTVDSVNAMPEGVNKKEWKTYLQDEMTEGPVQQNRWRGYVSVSEDMSSYFAGDSDSKSKDEIRQDLFNERYDSRTMSEKDYRTNLKRLDYDIPQHISDATAGILTQKRYAIGGRYTRWNPEESKIMTKVNNAVWDWVNETKTDDPEKIQSYTNKVTASFQNATSLQMTQLNTAMQNMNQNDSEVVRIALGSGISISQILKELNVNRDIKTEDTGTTEQ